MIVRITVAQLDVAAATDSCLAGQTADGSTNLVGDSDLAVITGTARDQSRALGLDVMHLVHEERLKAVLKGL